MPKRSTGCDLCRRRKVRCDETKPFCQRCQAFGAECPGYSGTSQVVFKDQTTYTTWRSQNRHRHRNTRTIDEEKASPSMGEDESLSSDQASSEQSSSRRPLSQQGSSREASYHEISMVPYSVGSLFDIDTTIATRSLILTIFLDSFLPAKADPASEDNAQYAFIRLLPHASVAHLPLSSALDTISLVHIATMKGDKDLQNESRHLYGRALNQLSQALLHPTTQTQDETLAAASILGLCDFYRATAQNRSSWISHVSGSQGVLAKRGPKSMKTDLVWRTFLNSRLQSSLLGILMRKSTDFDRPEWFECTSQSSEFNHFVAITDIMTRIPTLLQETDKILDAVHEIDLEQALNLLEQYKFLSEQLDNWYANVITSGTEPVIRTVQIGIMSGFQEVCPDSPFSAALTFSTVQLGFLITYYFFSKYILCRNAADLMEYLHSVTSDAMIERFSPNLPSLELLRGQTHNSITILTRCIAYLCSDACATIGRLQSLTFLWFAQDYFGSQSDTFQSLADNDRVQQDFEIAHFWCWKIYAALSIKGIVAPNIPVPDRSNYGGRIPTFDDQDDEEQGGLMIDRIASHLGFDLDGEVPSASSSYEVEKDAIDGIIGVSYASSNLEANRVVNTNSSDGERSWEDELVIRTTDEEPS